MSQDIRIALYLEIGRDGWSLVHCPDLPGLGYKAPSRDTALALACDRALTELEWARRAGVPALDRLGAGSATVPGGAGGLRAWPASDGTRGLRVFVAGEVTLNVPAGAGDTEVILEPEFDPAGDGYVRYALAYAEASRHGLSRLVEALSPAMLDWRPRRGKRSIGEILGHVADAEAFYLARLEDPRRAPWRDLRAGYAGRDLGLGPAERLRRTRAFVYERFEKLTEEDRRRVSVFPPHKETWSARKVLRRLVWHERYHTRQIEAFLTT